jgi:ribosomal protein L12E/L44/L45/RPP1/RPP2
LTADVAKVMAQLPGIVEALSGVDLRRLIESVPALKAATTPPPPDKDAAAKKTEKTH